MNTLYNVLLSDNDVSFKEKNHFKCSMINFCHSINIKYCFME